MASVDETVHPEKKMKLDTAEEKEENEDENPYTTDEEDFTFDMSTFDECVEDDDFYSLDHKEQYRTYMEQITKSEGFDVDLDSCPAIGGITRVRKEERPSAYAEAIECTLFAIRVYNKQPDNTKLEFVDAVKVTARAVAGYKFYITFLAIDTASGEQKTYQTKVYNNVIHGYMKVLLFRENPLMSGDN